MATTTQRPSSPSLETFVDACSYVVLFIDEDISGHPLSADLRTAAYRLGDTLLLLELDDTAEPEVLTAAKAMVDVLVRACRARADEELLNALITLDTGLDVRRKTLGLGSAYAPPANSSPAPGADAID